MISTLAALLWFYYRPHPKDGGRYCFQFVCQSTRRQGGGGTPARFGWWVGGVPWSGLDGGGYPGQVWMVGGGGTPARSGWWGVLQPGLDGVGGIPQPGLDGGGNLGYPPTHHDWMGYPPTMTRWGTPLP